MEVIGKKCFSLNKLEKIVIPSSVRCIEQWAFDLCDDLKQITFSGDGPEIIEKMAFQRSGLESFTASASLKKIGANAFTSCEELKYADFSACTLRSGGWRDFFSEDIFNDCPLENIVLPPTLQVVGKRAFAGLKSLKSVTLGDSSELEEIADGAFFGCGIESFTAPPKLKKIGDLAFGGCQMLKNLQLNKEIQELGWLCFWGTQIKNLKIPS